MQRLILKTIIPKCQKMLLNVLYFEQMKHNIFKPLFSLLKIGQNVTTLFVNTCD